MAMMASMLLFLLLAAAGVAAAAAHADKNDVYSPCEDAKVQRMDGFSFGIVFSSTRESFFSKNVQLSPCDSRLGFANNTSAKVSVFRPYVDEISLLTVNITEFPAIFGGTYMVAFAGRKYAARSLPTFVANNTYIVTGFTLVLEFQTGTLQNLYWKQDGCSNCSGNSQAVCIDNQECALLTSSCIGQGGSIYCNLGIQVAFSGTDQYDAVLNSWYEVSNLRQYSLYGLFSNLKDSFTSQLNSVF